MKYNRGKFQNTNFKFQLWPNGIWVLLFVFLIASCNNKKQSSDTGTITTVPTDGKEMYADTASSTVKVFDANGRVCIQQSNTYYETTDLYDGTNKIPLLLKIRKTELCYADSSNKDKVFEITAKNILGGTPVNWEAKFVATELDFSDNTLVVTREGEATEEDLTKRFNLMDGKEIFSACYELKLQIPNSKDRRFVGFTSRRTVSEPLKAYNEENLLGTIEYSSNQKAISTIKIKLRRSKVADKFPTSTPDMIFVPDNGNTTAIEDGKKLILMKADEHYKPADVKDFSVKLTFFYGDDNETTEISIPVSNDNFDPTKAKYDKEIFEIVSE